jgi:CheY-like chemotaxis protein
MTIMATRDILLVEDNPADAALAQQAFREAGVEADVSVARDGLAALAYLRREGEFVDATTPDLVLLDLKMPGMGGHQVLEQIKHDPELRTIPVAILSTSVAERDLVAAYAMHANSYFRKPVTFEDFVEMAKTIDRYWFDLVRLPPT